MNTRFVLLLCGAGLTCGCLGLEDDAPGDSGGSDSGASGGSSSASGGASTGSGGSTSGSGGASSGSGGASSGSGGASSGSGGSDPGCTPDFTCQPTPPPSSGDPAEDCVARVNQFRACVCLPPLERWTAAEDCADRHAEYDVTNGPHAGFGDQICESGGWAQNECPGWGSTGQVIDGCLQMMFDEGPPPSTPCEGSCFQEHGHYINMTSTRYARVACGFFTTNDGKVWSVQNFQ